jgi:hypothetical protein
MGKRARLFARVRLDCSLFTSPQKLNRLKVHLAFKRLAWDFPLFRNDKSLGPLPNAGHYDLSGLPLLVRKTTVLRFNNFPPMDIGGVRLIIALSLSRVATVLRKDTHHAKFRSHEDA